MKPSLLFLPLLSALTASLAVPERYDGPVAIIPAPRYSTPELDKLLNPQPKTLPKTDNGELQTETTKGPSDNPHHKFQLRPDPSLRSKPVSKLGLLDANLGWSAAYEPFVASIPNNNNGTVHISGTDLNNILYLRPSTSIVYPDKDVVPEFYVVQGNPEDDPVPSSTLWDKWTVEKTMETVDDGSWNIKEVGRYWLGVEEKYVGWLACRLGTKGEYGVFWTDGVYTGEGCSKPFRMQVMWE
ncbi:hypothetical protein BJ508DRAFT_73025 [Ascobolus immersus RN42]|uniref:Ubiquitin 3 binding protein But2 C-terminal domain-containing protein n=1 Tax=Ascobolus immersus RN42 TaxID=1160509 RepID=A0A3N4HE64_ASCIM|nr:hypothetical protein BJ508DRAFT_73025 [Ascobolus immersus RN42]